MKSVTKTAGKSAPKSCCIRFCLSHFFFLFSVPLCCVFFTVNPVAAQKGSGIPNVGAEWGGYVKARGQASFPPAASPYRAVESGTYLDGSLEGRLKNTLFWGDRSRLDTHYEIVASGGDTQGAQNELAALFGGTIPGALRRGSIPSDDRRLMNLTRVLREEDDLILYHRLDRLALTLSPEWGTVSVGRQAVTWGNGFLFNPMDLFNPFSPTDIERDYKIGDDMLFVQAPVAGSGNVQALYVPRRDPVEGDIVWDESSLAVKAHLFQGAAEFDLMAAKHYTDYVFGAGATGYLGGAAWRTDLTWTHLDPNDPGSDYPSLVANIDYSWTWWEKNLYGFVEFFYSGVGNDDYREALTDPNLTDRIGRGELFTLGRTYLAGYIRLEIHPLVNLYFTSIVNTADPSGVVQPRITWDAAADVQVLIGGNLFWGPRESEYGGISIPGTPFTTRASDSVYGWIGYYF
jgi:hypothetical protein